MDGHFIIKNVQVGKHILNISYIGYYQEYDSVFIKDNAEIINLEIKLIPLTFKLDTVAEIENHHRHLKKLKSENVLKVTLDSLGIENKSAYRLIVYSTFHNETDTPLYVIANQDFANTVFAKVYNSNGGLVKPYQWMISCLIPLLSPPMSSDFFKIEPHSSIKYAPVYLDHYDFADYISDTYAIKLNYSNEKWSSLPGYPQGNKQDYLKWVLYFNMALRGDYISTDSLLFDNSKISKVKAKK